MSPAAAVAGWYFAHPEARYFGLGRINRDQIEDYARRKGMTLAEAERWLAPNLAYEPERRIAFQAWMQKFVDHGISSTLNLPSVEEHAIDASDFAAMLYKHLPNLRGITAYPDGARGGQPLTVVPFSEASESEGLEFEEYGSEYACKGGVCGI